MTAREAEWNPPYEAIGKWTRHSSGKDKLKGIKTVLSEPVQ